MTRKFLSLAVAAALAGATLTPAPVFAQSASDIQALQNSGYEAFLIGESLMSEKNIAQTLKKLIDTNHELK